MIPVDEFYSKLATEQQRLVDNDQVVVEGKITNTVPSPDQHSQVYVFDEPVTNIFLKKLKGARYTAKELEPEFPIDREELDDLFYWLKYEPLELLTNHYGVLRVADIDGAAYVYTIEVLPFETRYLDPTLSGYLLDANDRCPISAPQIATKSRRSAYYDYIDRLSEYWGIPGDELRSQFSDIPGLATSTLGPLPVVEDLPNPDRVTERFRSVPESYQRKRHDVRRVKQKIAFHKSQCRRNPSLGAFQSFALYLFDLNEYVTIEGDAQLRDLVIQGGEIFYRCLYGDLWAGGPTPWEPFITTTTGDLDTRDRRVVDIVEHQPTSNGQLADRWGFEDGKAVWTYLQDELNGLTTRNSDQFICATESARKYVEGLANDGKIELSKEPPRVPGQGRINLEVSTQKKNDGDSGVDWSRL